MQARKIFVLEARSQNREEHTRFSCSKQEAITLKVFRSQTEKKQEDSPIEGSKKPKQRRFSRSRQEDKTEKKNNTEGKQEAKTEKNTEIFFRASKKDFRAGRTKNTEGFFVLREEARRFSC